LSIERNPIREPDLTRLRDLPRGEAVRIAIIKYGWDAETAGRKVEVEQGRRAQEGAERKRGQST
jgi:hypothetical protein